MYKISGTRSSGTIVETLRNIHVTRSRHHGRNPAQSNRHVNKFQQKRKSISCIEKRRVTQFPLTFPDGVDQVWTTLHVIMSRWRIALLVGSYTRIGRRTPRLGGRPEGRQTHASRPSQRGQNQRCEAPRPRVRSGCIAATSHGAGRRSSGSRFVAGSRRTPTIRDSLSLRRPPAPNFV